MPLDTELHPLPAQDVLEKFYLEARARLLEVAATLDRIDRGHPVPEDPRLQLLRKAIGQLQKSTAVSKPDRAEKLQLLFSLAYEEGWMKTFQPSR
jgi:hypothetical protein